MRLDARSDRLGARRAIQKPAVRSGIEDSGAGGQAGLVQLPDAEGGEVAMWDCVDASEMGVSSVGSQDSAKIPGTR